MSNNYSFVKLGGRCSLLLGVSHILIGLNYLLIMPAEQKVGVSLLEHFTSLAQNPVPSQINYSLVAISTFLGLASVLGIGWLVYSVNEAWTCWASIVGMVGFLLMAISDLRALYLAPLLAQKYVAGDVMMRLAVETAYTTMSLDPIGWSRGFLGLWICVLSVLGLRGQKWASGLSYLGLVAASLYGLLVIGNLLNIPILLAVGAGLGALVAMPLWYFGMGLTLLRSTIV